MGLQKTGALAFLILMFSPAEALSIFYDPRFCYILDAVLLIYGVIITVLFLREKFCQTDAKTQNESLYQDLKGNRSTYDGLRQRDAESGRARGAHRDDGTYTRLQKKTEDTYKEIHTKRDRRQNDQVYQGLSSATKDTYDQLHMQPLPPRRER